MMNISLTLGLSVLLGFLVRSGQSQGYFQSFFDPSNSYGDLKEKQPKNDVSLFSFPFLPFELPQLGSREFEMSDQKSPKKTVMHSRDSSLSAATSGRPGMVKDGRAQSKAMSDEENIMVNFWNSFLPLGGGLPWMDYDDESLRDAKPEVISIVHKTEHLPKSSRQKSPSSGTEKDSVIFLQRVGVSNVCQGNTCDGNCKNDKCPAKVTKAEREYRKNLFDKFFFLIIPGIIGLGVVCLGIEMLKKHREISRKCLIVTDLNGLEHC